MSRKAAGASTAAGSSRNGRSVVSRFSFFSGHIIIHLILENRLDNKISCSMVQDSQDSPRLNSFNFEQKQVH